MSSVIETSSGSSRKTRFIDLGVEKPIRGEFGTKEINLPKFVSECGKVNQAVTTL